MSKLSTALVQAVGTDTSGKWINVDKIEELVDILVTECIDKLILHGYDDASAQLMKNFVIEKDLYDDRIILNRKINEKA